jgi:hypothetical protein
MDSDAEIMFEISGAHSDDCVAGCPLGCCTM